jgi:hypothetical protein
MLELSSRRLSWLAVMSVMAAAGFGAAPALAASDDLTAASIEGATSATVSGTPAAMTSDAAAASAQTLNTSLAAVTSGAARVTCWSWTPYARAKSLVGLTVWQYNQEVYWCGNGRTITYRAPAHDYPTHVAVGWEFKGNGTYWNHGGAGSSYWEHWNQGHFCLASYFGCLQNKYPWIDSTVYANGAGHYTYGW